MTIASLIVEVGANVANLTTSVEKVQGSLGNMASFAQKAAGVLGAAFAASEISGAAQEVTAYAGHLDDMRKKAGITAEAVQELDFAAKQNGLSFDTVSSALAKMSKNILEGGKASQEAISGLGLSVDTLKGMAPDQAFEAIAQKIAGIPDPMLRSKTAMDIFGKSGAELLPLLTENIGQLRQQARDAGLVMSNDLVAAGDRVGDTWDQMQARLQALKGQALLPVLDLFTQLPQPMQTIVGAGLALAPSLGGIGTAIVAAGGPVAAMGALSTAFTAILPFLGPAGLIAVAVFAVYEVWKHWDKIAAIAQGVYTAVKTWLVDKFDAIVGWVKGKVDAVTGFFQGMYDKVVGHSYVPDMITRIGQEFGKLDSEMVEPAQTAMGQVLGIFSRGLSSLPQMLASGFTGGGGVRGGINGMLSTAGGELFGPSGPFGFGAGGALNGLGNKMAGIFGSSFGLALPGIGTALGALIGPMMGKLADVAWTGLKKIGGFFKDVFGGPNAEELAGRDLVSAFERNLSSMLTESQRIEAGNDAWKQTVIAIRDQYLAFGLTEQQALTDAKRLWDSSRQGAEASRQVIEEIKRNLAGGFHVPVNFDVGPLALPGGVDFPGATLDIPQMATGGIVTGPTIAMIGEGRGPEAVIPLDRLDGGGTTGSRREWADLRAEISQLRQRAEEQAAYFAGRFAKDLARAVRDQRQLARAGGR